MPYAYGANIKHEFDVNHLNVWVTFKHPMKRSSDPLHTPPVYDWMPPLNKWLLKCDNLPIDIIDSAWQDAFTILLTSNTVTSQPARVTLEYAGPNDHLQAAWQKDWEPWGPIISADYAGYKLPGFIDRGDPANFDWQLTDLNPDGDWHDLDCSTIIPAGAKAILFRTLISAVTVDISLGIRKKGNSNDRAASWSNTQSEAVWTKADMIVACNSARKCEYMLDSEVWGAVYITVAGWWL